MGGSKRTDDSISWPQALSKVHLKGVSPDGPGWKTMIEIRGDMGCGVCKARRLVNQMIKSGEVETFVGSSPAIGGGLLCRNVWYRPIDKKQH
jgi:hypothetical protein